MPPGRGLVGPGRGPAARVVHPGRMTTTVAQPHTAEPILVPAVLLSSTPATTTTTTVTPVDADPWNSPAQPPRRRRLLVVPQTSCQGGLDFKFNANPDAVSWQGWFATAEDYTRAIQRINATLKPARAQTLDAALLVTGPLLVPLALWAVRHGRQQRLRKQLLHQAIQDFHQDFEHLHMRWNRHAPGGSFLSIQERSVASPVRRGGVDHPQHRQQPYLPTGLEDSSVLV